MIPCCLVEWVQLGLVVILLAFIALCVIVKLTTDPFPRIETFEQEKCYKVTSGGSETRDFPDLAGPGSVDLSVIVPAYNETERLPKMLDECLGFLSKRATSYEVEFSIVTSIFHSILEEGDYHYLVPK